MNLDNYLAIEEYYPVVIVNACTCYALGFLQEMYDHARRTGNSVRIQEMMENASLRRNICHWVRTRLEEKVVDADLVNHIMSDIKWSTVLTKIQEYLNDPSLSESENEEEEIAPSPAPQVRRHLASP